MNDKDALRVLSLPHFGDYSFKEFMELMEQLKPEDRESLIKEINEAVERQAMEELIKNFKVPPMEPRCTYPCDWQCYTISDRLIFGPDSWGYDQPAPILSMKGGLYGT